MSGLQGYGDVQYLGVSRLRIRDGDVHKEVLDFEQGWAVNEGVVQTDSYERSMYFHCGLRVRLKSACKVGV